MPFIIINLIPFCKSYSHFACPPCRLVSSSCCSSRASPLHRPLVCRAKNFTSLHAPQEGIALSTVEQFPVFLILKLVLKQLLYSGGWLLHPHANTLWPPHPVPPTCRVIAASRRSEKENTDTASGKNITKIYSWTVTYTYNISPSFPCSLIRTRFIFHPAPHPSFLPSECCRRTKLLRNFEALFVYFVLWTNND